MVKVSLFIFIFSALVAGVHQRRVMAQATQNLEESVSLEGYQLHGSVRTVEQRLFRLKSNEASLEEIKLSQPPEKTLKIRFNKEGNLIRLKRYKGDNLVSKEKLIYRKNGKLSRRIVHTGGNSKQYWYIYDADYELMTMKLVMDSRLVKEKRYFNGRIIVTYKANNLAQIVKMRDIGRGFHLKKVYGADRELHSKWLYELDDNGRIVQKIFYSKADQPGTLHLQIVYSKELTYNQYGYVKQIKTYRLGNLQNEKSFHYTYDGHHNWVKKIILKNGIPISVMKREITYY